MKTETFRPKMQTDHSKTTATMSSILMNGSAVIDVLDQYRIPAVIACIVGLLLSSCFNILILLVLPKTQYRFGENAHLCLICLAVIDLLGGLMCFGTRIVFEFNRPLLLNDRTRCAVIACSCTAFVSQSNFLFAILSIDRYIAIIKPMRYWSMLSRTRIKRIITIAIVCGSTVSVARLLHSIYTDSCDFDTGASMYIGNPSMMVYMASVFLLGSATGYLNIKVLITAYKQHTRISNMPVTNAETKEVSPRIGGKFKAAITITTMIGAYYIVWTPYVIGVAIVTFSGRPIPEPVYFALLYIAFSNHFLNAMIHFCLQKNLRLTLCKMISRREDSGTREI